MKIIIATEGSEFSRAAIEKCCQIFGNTTDVEIKIVAVFELTIPPTEPFTLSLEYIQQMNEEAKIQATKIAQAAENQIRENCPALADKISQEIQIGSPEQIIVEDAEKWGADLIVVGSHGYGFWKRAWLGSVSNSIVHHAHCSVLVVKN